MRTDLALEKRRRRSGGDRVPAQHTRENLSTEQTLRIFEELALFETDMGRQQVGEAKKDFAIGNLEFAHQALHGAMLDQGAGNDGGGACGFQSRQEIDFLFTEMRQQFGNENITGMQASRNDRFLDAAFSRTPPLQGESKRRVVLARKFLEFGAALHDGQCCPPWNISL